MHVEEAGSLAKQLVIPGNGITGLLMDKARPQSISLLHPISQTLATNSYFQSLYATMRELRFTGISSILLTIN